MTYDNTPSNVIIEKSLRANHVTIRELKARTGFTLKLIRDVLANGVSDHYAMRDWIQAIEGTDPGNMSYRGIVFRKPKYASR